MDYTDIEKAKAIRAAAEAKQILQETRVFWLKLKTSDPNTTSIGFDQVLQVELDNMNAIRTNTIKNGDTDFDS